MYQVIYKKLSKFDKLLIESLFNSYGLPAEFIEVQNLDDVVDTISVDKKTVIIAAPSSSTNKIIEKLSNSNYKFTVLPPMSKIKTDEDKKLFMKWFIKESQDPKNKIASISSVSDKLVEKILDGEVNIYTEIDGKQVLISDDPPEGADLVITTSELASIYVASKLFNIKGFKLRKEVDND